MLTVLALSSGDLFAKQVSVEQAENYAKVVFAKYTDQPALKNNTTLVQISSQFTKEMNGEETFHIFNISPKGFVVISAEDNYNAVLAFSDENSVDFNDEVRSVGFFGELSRHEQRIEYTRVHNLKANQSIQSEWATLKGETNNNQTPLKSDQAEGAIVEPLTTSLWDQGEFYNAQCPVSLIPNDTLAPDGLTYSGCVTVAFAQLMKFHEWPLVGNGAIDYIDPVYGFQSADFCNTTYNWDNMPDSLSTDNEDVAGLIYDTAVSIESSFSTTYTSAFVSYVRDALVYYFNYDPSAALFPDDGDGFAIIAKQDLDEGRPVLLTGTAGGGGAHAWVCDGYGCFTNFGATEPADYFHFNLGWGGDYNGWYLDTGSSWEPLSDQPGTGIIYYYWERWVVHNVFPGSGCNAPEDARVDHSGVTENSTYLTLSSPLEEEEFVCRYRAVGATEWIELPPYVGYAQYINGLFPGTEYEYQLKRKCCPNTWSDYSNVGSFTTEGELCGAIDAGALYTSSIGETVAYIYTPLTYGNVNNQFRYKEVGSNDWINTNVDDIGNRYLTDLSPATVYEFQVRSECGGGEWTAWSGSHIFETEGAHFEFHGTILLEGPYVGGGTMSKNLNLSGLIPNNQPFSEAPYFHTGTENLDNNVPSDMVDWVLVELRTGTPSLTGDKSTTTIETVAALLMADGSIFGPDKQPGIKFTSVVPGDEYYFCVRHRNHLDVLTATSISGSTFMSYNFTSNSDKAFGVEQVKATIDGFYAMHAGDYNQDGVIQTTDYDVWQSDPAVNNTYNRADGNLDGVVQATDFDTWFPNKAKVGTIEIDY